MTLAFHGSADTFLKFFEEVQKRGLETEEERVKLLLEMMEEGEKISTWHTERSKEQIVEDYRKHGNVLWISPKENNNELE